MVHSSLITMIQNMLKRKVEGKIERNTEIVMVQYSHYDIKHAERIDDRCRDRWIQRKKD